MADPVVFTVTDGPSLLDLQLEVIDRMHPRDLQFKLFDGVFEGTTDATVNGIKWNNSGYDSWIICGWFNVRGTTRHNAYHILFEAFYNTRRRDGQARVNPKEMRRCFNSISIRHLMWAPKKK